MTYPNHKVVSRETFNILTSKSQLESKPDRSLNDASINQNSGNTSLEHTRSSPRINR